MNTSINGSDDRDSTPQLAPESGAPGSFEEAMEVACGFCIRGREHGSELAAAEAANALVGSAMYLQATLGSSKTRSIVRALLKALGPSGTVEIYATR